MDVKSVYYSVCIAYILQDFCNIDVECLSSFIKSCLVSSATSRLSFSELTLTYLLTVYS